MKRLLLLSTIVLTSCATAVTPESAKIECDAYEWDAERNDCYRELAVSECQPDLCDLFEIETTKNSCKRAVERSCK